MQVKILVQKVSLGKIMLVQKVLGPNQFEAKENFGSKKIGSKNVRSKKIWAQYILVKQWVNKNLGSKKFQVQTKYGSKNSR